jgi:hypothetical protein
MVIYATYTQPPMSWQNLVATIAAAFAAGAACIAVLQARGAGRDAARRDRLDRLAEVSRWVEDLAQSRAAALGDVMTLATSPEAVRLAVTGLHHAIAAAHDDSLPACRALVQEVRPDHVAGLPAATVDAARAEVVVALEHARAQ